jgi:hypothetical protein
LKKINKLCNNGGVIIVYVLKNIGIQERWLTRDIFCFNRRGEFI